jgi:hypothetical protein
MGEWKTRQHSRKQQKPHEEGGGRRLSTTKRRWRLPVAAGEAFRTQPRWIRLLRLVQVLQHTSCTGEDGSGMALLRPGSLWSTVEMDFWDDILVYFSNGE